jgi:hypothetical protein
MSERINPVFHRWTWALQLKELFVLSLSDPSLYASNLHANWFQSGDEIDYFSEIAHFIKKIAVHLNVDESKIILYGSSMGGFGSLMIGANIPNALSIAEVPQIDLRNYSIASSLRQLESAHFGGRSIEQYATIHPHRINVLDRYLKFECAPSTHIITNEADPEFKAHIKFISDLKGIGSRIKYSGSTTITCLSEASGHKPLETAAAIKIIRGCIAAGWTSSKTPEKSTGTHPETSQIDRLEPETYQSVLGSAIAAAKEVKYTRTKEDQIQYANATALLIKAAELDNNADWPLLKLCSMTKLWNNSFGHELLTYAEKAFHRRQTLESFIYFCRGIIANFTPTEAVGMLDDLQAKCLDAQTSNVAHIFRAIVKYETGDFDGYENEILIFRQNKANDFNPYITIPVSTVITDTSGLMEYRPEYQPSLLSSHATPRLDHSENIKYVISASCDINYFKIYGEYLVRSFTQFCSSEAHLQITLTSAHTPEIDDLLQKWGANSVTVRYCNLDCGINEGPIASLIRFSVIHGLLITAKVPVFVFDLDAAIKKSLLPIVNDLEGNDLCSRVLKGGIAPWEKYTGGFALFYPTENGLFIAQAIAKAAEMAVDRSVKQWWIDQNCFEAGIRTAIKANKVPVISDFYSTRNDYCVMPVGTQEAKLYALRNALSVLESSKSNKA